MRWIAVVGLAWASASGAFAQMGGVPVGKPSVMPVGNQLPQVGTKLPSNGTGPYQGNPLTNASLVSPKPGGVDPKSVVAPYPTGTPSTGEKSVWDKLYDRWLGFFSSNEPAKLNTNWTPSMGRRARERKEDRFRRD